MEVNSRPGEETEFRIYFPAADVSVPPATAPAPSDAVIQGGGKHVLYVDDEEAIVYLMKRLLERQDFRLSGYTDPHDAPAARRSPGIFDLAVSDYSTPGMSDLDVAQQLRQIRPDLLVLMASGYITQELRAKAPAAGIREPIYEPNTADDLCEAVARYARGRHKHNVPA